jgi:hypothetical protein
MNFLKLQNVGNCSMKWSLFLVLRLTIAELTAKVLSYLQIILLVHICIRTEEVKPLISRIDLHSLPDFTPAIILRVLFCKVNTVLLLGELLQTYSMFDYGMEIVK